MGKGRIRYPGKGVRERISRTNGVLSLPVYGKELPSQTWLGSGTNVMPPPSHNTSQPPGICALYTVPGPGRSTPSLPVVLLVSTFQTNAIVLSLLYPLEILLERLLCHVPPLGLQLALPRSSANGFPGPTGTTIVDYTDAPNRLRTLLSAVNRRSGAAPQAEDAQRNPYKELV